MFASSGEALTFRHACRCYGLGSLANTVLPGRLGEAVRIELFGRLLGHPHRRWLACGVSATVALAQAVVLALMLVVGAISGQLPPWTVAPALALPTLLCAGGVLARRRRPHGRVACLATATTLPALSWARLLGCVAVGALARLLLATAVLDALSVPRPLSAAVVAIGALAVGNALPFAPGAAGVPAAAMAVGLSRSGIHTGSAVAAAISFHAFETGAVIVLAAVGWLATRLGPETSAHRRAEDTARDREVPIAVAAALRS